MLPSLPISSSMGGPLNRGAAKSGAPTSPSTLLVITNTDGEHVSTFEYDSPTPLPHSASSLSDSDLTGTSSSSGDCGSERHLPGLTFKDRACMRCFVLGTLATLTALCMMLLVAWTVTAMDSVDPATGRVIPYSCHYFILCLLGGVVAGLAHIVVTPIDVVKCRVQVGDCDSLREGLSRIYHVEAGGSLTRALPLLFRGWAPTLYGYCIQGALKFSLYEVLKYGLVIHPMEKVLAKEAASPAMDSSSHHGSLYFSGAVQVLLFLVASAIAEAIADLGLAPFEALKIRVQTSPSFPSSLQHALPRIWEAEGLHGFYKGLVPLWCRQVPYTMMKFASFEKMVVLVQALVDHLFHAAAPTQALSSGPTIQSSMAPLLQPHGSAEKLLVSLIAGIGAGLLCGLISHPADTILSRRSQGAVNGRGVHGPLLGPSSPTGEGGHGPLPRSPRPGTEQSLREIARELGWWGVWKGLGPRLVMVCTLTALQWLMYDGFKVAVGLPTSGGVPKR